MVKPDPKTLHSHLPCRLQTLMLLRVIFLSLFFGASIFIQFRETRAYFGHIQTFHYLLAAVVYFVTFIYVILLKFSKKFTLQAYLQLLFDTLFITAVIYSTGGIESLFSSFYFLAIIYGSIMLYRRGGMIVASTSSILYGTLLDLHYYGVIHPLGSRLSYPEQYRSGYLLYIILVNIIAFYVVAFLSSYVSEQARRSSVELKAKQIDFDKLEILNESIINSITSGLIALDDQDRIALFNPAAEEMLGRSGQDVSGMKLEEALPFIRPYLSQGCEPREPGPWKPPPLIDLPYSRPDGNRMYLRLSISPLMSSLGQQRGRILIFQDMTEMKRIEEEMKKVEGLAMMGKLAAGIAHEIRNPMASISGSIQLLKNGLGEDDDVNRRLMDIISREINRLNHLVNDFLIFARPSKPCLQEFDLNQLIVESLELFKNSQHLSDKIHIVTEFQKPLRLTSDPEQLKQILWNLFLNASEAMPDGGSLHIKTEVIGDASQID
ncbi:MAG: hypothetical protein DRN37_07265, partial [Thermoplasmata archaeon]